MIDFSKVEVLVVGLLVLIVGFGSGVRVTYIDLTQEYQSKMDNMAGQYQYEISLKNDSIQSIQDAFNLLENRYNLLNDNYSGLQELQDELQDEYNLLDGKYNEELISYSNLESEYNLLKSGDKYNLHDPTYDEMIDFLERDKTDENSYIDVTYDCSHFTRDVNNNAEKDGIRCAYVVLEFNIQAHAIVAFNTVDSGLIYVEPQDDKIADTVEVGMTYYDCFGSTLLVVNDTIITILVYW